MNITVFIEPHERFEAFGAAIIFLATGFCFICFFVPYGISLLINNKSWWNVVIWALAGVFGVYFTAHGTASFLDALASTDRRAENVRVHSVIIPELKFRDVERHVFGAHLMEASNNTAFEDAPEALNRVGMNRADHVLLAVVIDRLMTAKVS